MKVEIRGWKRDHGAKRLINEDIEELKIVKMPDRYQRGATYLMAERDVQDEVEKFVISRSVNGLVASGDYLVNIEISMDEILALAHRRLKNMTVQELGRYITKLK